MNRCKQLAVWLVVLVTYTGTLLIVMALRILVRRRSRPRPGGIRVLVTGRFDNAGWCAAHLVPLCRARNVAGIIAVVDGPTVDQPEIRYSRPPNWMRALLGRALAKTVTMIRTAIPWKPDVVMGFHIFPGALSALLTARLIGAGSIYQMTAGPIELIGGGAGTENALLRHLGRPSRILEFLAFALCRQFDAVVVRGSRAREFLLPHANARRVRIIAGGIDVDRFAGANGRRPYDVAYVGRLNPIKRPEHVVEVIAKLAESRPHLRAVIVGDGPLLPEIRRRAERLGVSARIELPGPLHDVSEVLRQTKVFVLTSRNEGLAIALAEAMCAGAVPVVADVGDLAELVEDGVTGWRVPPTDFAAYARRVDALLADPQRWRQLSDAGRRRATENNALPAIAAKWEQCLEDVIRDRSSRKPTRTHHSKST